MARTCIIFLHIPKTGGVTLTNVFRWKYKPSEIVRLITLQAPNQRLTQTEEIQQIPLGRLRDVRAVMGHVYYGIHERIPKECEYVTILREPIARVISMYRYIRGDPKHWLHKEMVASGMTLEEFVASNADPGLDNHQTRMLAGRGTGHFAPWEETSPVAWSDLEEAKRNLDKFLVVGLTEKFDESFILIRRALGWKLPLYLAGNVSSHTKVEVTPEATELIRQRNQLDLELYDHALELFSAAVGGQGPSFEREVAAFKLVNKIPNKIGPHAGSLIRRLFPSKFGRSAKKDSSASTSPS
jgi:hypothetical protein